MKRIPILLFVVGMMVGCSNVYSAEEGYRMAVINPGFPIPENASELKPEACTTEIAKSAKYKLNAIGGEQGEPPEHYLEEIKKWGWTELEDEQRGNIHFYEKEGKVMSLVFKKNIFDVFEMSSEVKM
ncbi:MAG: hypothetical protein ABS920_00775 [Sporosarcina sp.]